MQAQRRLPNAPRPEKPVSNQTPGHSGIRAFDETTAEMPRGSVLFGKYVVERTLGAGGMGIVTGVRHNVLGELFAIKVLRDKALRKHPTLGRRFLNEARAAAQLRSDHVVRVYDVGTLDSGRPYMMMEHLEGRDLGAVVAEDGPLEASKVVDYTLQALDAITEAHTLGIVHRDLKPDNLFLATRPNGGMSVKVLDFGISKQLDVMDSDSDMGDSDIRPISSKSRITGASGIMGSPYYMSPEQMSCETDVDARADVWGLGVIMYEMLTGEPPFVGNSIAQIYASVLTGNSIPLAEAAPNTPPRLIRLVERCLARERADRPQTAAEMVAELTAIQAEASLAELAQRESAPSASNKILDLVATDGVSELDPRVTTRVATNSDVIVEWVDSGADAPEYVIDVDGDAASNDVTSDVEIGGDKVWDFSEDIALPEIAAPVATEAAKARRSRARKTINRWLYLIPVSMTIACVCVVGKAAVVQTVHEVASMVSLAR